jgi:hypothetical protein
MASFELMPLVTGGGGRGVVELPLGAHLGGFEELPRLAEVRPGIVESSHGCRPDARTDRMGLERSTLSFLC